MDGYGTPSNLNQNQFATHLPMTPPPVSEQGSPFALQKQQAGFASVAPSGAANWGVNRFTTWGTGQFGANRGSGAVQGSFLNFDAMNRPAPGAVEVQ